MDLMGRTGEQVKFKFFTMLINFKTYCFRGGDDHLKAAINLFLLHFGGENHLKAAIALLVNKQSFSPPNPLTPWLGEHSRPWKKAKVKY